MPSRIILSLLLCGSIAQALFAQQGAVVSGRVTDRSTGKSIQGARVTLEGERRSLTTDSSGTYSFDHVPAGVARIIVRAPSFPALQVIVELVEGQPFERPILMDSTAFGRLAAAQSLPAVGVTAQAPVTNYRLVGFELRRVNGRGQYLTEDEIVRTGAYTVADAVKGMRGVNYECGGGGGCFVRMSRAPMQCLPEYIVDDQVMNDFGPTTPIRDVIAIEVYTGPTELPGEYSGRNGGCGVVVIWTRSGPPKRRR
jgi:hypothetical protein